MKIKRTGLRKNTHFLFLKTKTRRKAGRQVKRIYIAYVGFTDEHGRVEATWGQVGH